MFYVCAEISCMNSWILFAVKEWKWCTVFLLDGSGWELMGMDGSYGNGWGAWVEWVEWAEWVEWGEWAVFT